MVTVLDALTYAGNEASPAPVRDDIEFVHGSVAEADLVDQLVARHDVVVHLAAVRLERRRGDPQRRGLDRH
jgi:dTDP-glucose 4,6-dehydratase